jgi:hypothetical protein
MPALAHEPLHDNNENNNSLFSYCMPSTYRIQGHCFLLNVLPESHHVIRNPLFVCDRGVYISIYQTLHLTISCCRDSPWFPCSRTFTYDSKAFRQNELSEFDLSKLMSCLRGSVYLRWADSKKSSRMTPVLYGWKMIWLQ